MVDESGILVGCLHGVACRLIPLELTIGTACVVTLNIRVRAGDERPDRVGKTQLVSVILPPPLGG